jgi:hypothetical protein
MHASHTAAGANIPQPAVLQVSGRISIESAPLPGQNTQSGHYFMAPFSLQGNAEQGRIDLQSPTGNLLAVLRWQKGSASIEQAGKAPLLYPDLPTMLAVALGENSPSPALLFAWLQGLSSAEAGAHPDWLVDSSQFAAKGLISAERLQPLPRTKVRIKLDQTP